ncbi:MULTISPECIES: DUF4337 domain-containing protein [Delftia]|uniref:DUF4337 domain-containing protein n=1 Tax=Delftia lacustris TaxID=558537 RepID=A0A1H3R5J6_9BURK|nr:MULTISPECIES: DUF4337 domain-containing protein [Delftia]KEH12345.1 membrane protein [Delftia sp. 670]KLO57780.1 membrane protein [Delftia tsuruhatensis]MBS3720763.1 hypothetical protein [Delftia sp. PE138]MCO5336846.1 DUF4337 domain-containing protein [Delftia tsuruhatensis]MCR4543535.1 DUF4337 domain-containing protein [Delftia tsuruhatensis]
MSSGGFHVHGPHDHELEHAAQGEHGHTAHHGIGGGSLTNQIAMCTAVIATVGAIFAYMGGATQANAGLYKNDAAIKKTEAANQWAFFQAKSTKQSLSEFARDLATTEDRRAAYQAKVERYEKEKDDIKRDADRLEAEARQWDEKSEMQMHLHHRWAQATTALQVAIALAAIALLTKKKWLEYAMLGVAALGLGVGGLAMLHI